RLATASALPDDLEGMRARGLTLQTVETSASSLLQGVKSTSYAEAFAARRSVEADDALLVSGDVVRECATANIWWRRGETLYTPAVGAGVLPGVTRGFLLELQDAAEVRIPILRGPARLAEVFALLPQVKRALPEAELPLERPRVIGSMLASSFVLQVLRRSQLRPVARELLTGLLSLAPAALALRG